MNIMINLYCKIILNDDVNRKKEVNINEEDEEEEDF